MRRISLLAVLALVSGTAFAQAAAKKSIYTYVQGNGEWKNPYGGSIQNVSSAEWAIGYSQNFKSQPRISMGAEFFFSAHAIPNDAMRPVGIVKEARAKIYADLYGFGLYVDTRFFVGASYTWKKSVSANGNILLNANIELNFLGTGSAFIDDASLTFGYFHSLSKGWWIGTDLGIHFNGEGGSVMRFGIRWNVLNLGWSYESFTIAGQLRLEPRFRFNGADNGELFFATYGSFRYSFDIK